VYQRKRLRKTAPLAYSKLNQQFGQLHCQSEVEENLQNPKECIKNICYSDKSQFNIKNNSAGLSRLRNHPKSQAEECNNSPRMETIGGSVMRIQKTKRNTEMCERHVPQLLIRGEHVVSVVLM
jgi:hypothetical protein